MSLCRNLKSEYESLQTLTHEFVSACEKGKQNGNFQHLSPQELRTLQIKKQHLETARDALKDKLFVSPEAAREIMGKDRVFSREEIHAAFGFNIPAKDLPPIRWSTQELKEAKERGDYLIYRPSTYRPDASTDTTSIPLTMQKIAELVQPTLTANNQGKALLSTSWYQNEPFYTEDTPRKGWALVSKEPLSESTNKNYLQQTDRIVKELQTLYPPTDTRPIAKTTHKAIEDFHSKRTEIEQLIKDKKWKEAADILEPLLITQQTRHTASEAYYDAMLLRAATKSDKLISNSYTWTSSPSSSGFLVNVGLAVVSGADVFRWRADDRHYSFGVLFVRRWTSGESSVVSS